MTCNGTRTELQDYVQWNGEKPRDEGSYAAAFHRTWLNLRSKLSGGDVHVVLAEAERGEDSFKQAYEDALKLTAGSAVNDCSLDNTPMLKQVTIAYVISATVTRARQDCGRGTIA